MPIPKNNAANLNDNFVSGSSFLSNAYVPSDDIMQIIAMGSRSSPVHNTVKA